MLIIFWYDLHTRNKQICVHSHMHKHMHVYMFQVTLTYVTRNYNLVFAHMWSVEPTTAHNPNFSSAPNAMSKTD